MKPIRIPYGEGSLEVRIPEKNLIGVVKPKDREGVQDLPREIERALANPIGTGNFLDTLKRSDRVAILVDDWTRPTPIFRILPSVLKKLSDKGIKREDITVVMARGQRPLYSDRKLQNKERAWVEKKVGKDVSRHYHVILHSCDDKNTVFYGTTSLGTPIWINRDVAEADLKIGIGNIIPHEGAGYGGGGKIILPGVSSRETIECNHRFYFSSKSVLGNIVDNPVRNDMNEAAEIVGLKIINTVLNHKGEIVRIFAGDPVAAWLEGTELSREIFGYKIDEMADVVLVAPGPSFGIGLDTAFKGVLAARWVCASGGTIILVSQCPDGIGWPAFMQFMKWSSEEIMRKFLQREIIDAVAVECERVARLRDEKRIVVVSEGISGSEAHGMGLEYFSSPDEALQNTIGDDREQKRVLVIIEGVSMMPIFVG